MAAPRMQAMHACMHRYTRLLLARALRNRFTALGAGLGLPVIAEGVETAEELSFLVAEKCHAAQGYFIGRPGPISGFEQQTRGARQRASVAA